MYPVFVKKCDGLFDYYNLAGRKENDSISIVKP